jgi:hypothetical protein
MDPGRLQQVLAREQPFRSLEEGDEQNEFAFRQRHGIALRVEETPSAALEPPPPLLFDGVVDCTGT